MVLTTEPWLTKLVIRGYRSCRSTNFTPHRSLSVLIGINGSGKTSLLNAVRLLSLPGRRYASRPSEDGDMDNETEIDASFMVGQNEVYLRRKIKLDISSRNVEEIASATDYWNLRSITGKNIWHKFPPWFFEGREFPPHFMYAPSQFKASDAQIKALSRVFDNKTANQAMRAVTKYRNGIAYYSASQFTDPSKCPISFEIEHTPSGAERYSPPRPPYGTSRPHWKFVHDLYALQASNPELYAEYVNFISRGQLGMVTKVTWKKVVLSSSAVDVRQGGKVKQVRKQTTLIIPKVQIGASHLTFNQLSEGTFKTIALIFYIMTDASRCLLIEEPEVCVHHGLLTKVMDVISAHSPGKQIILSTHSDQVLDRLAVENVFVVEMKRGGTAVKDLDSWLAKRERSALNTYLNESGALGEYWKAGGFS